MDTGSTTSHRSSKKVSTSNGTFGNRFATSTPNFEKVNGGFGPVPSFPTYQSPYFGKPTNTFSTMTNSSGFFQSSTVALLPSFPLFAQEPSQTFANIGYIFAKDSKKMFGEEISEVNHHGISTFVNKSTNKFEKIMFVPFGNLVSFFEKMKKTSFFGAFSDITKLDPKIYQYVSKIILP